MAGLGLSGHRNHVKLLNLEADHSGALPRLKKMLTRRVSARQDPVEFSEGRHISQR